MRKFLSVLLAFAMMLSLGVTTLAAEDTAVGTTAVEQTDAGKTVILHSNDVHGAITGYACIAALKTDYESRGAEVILVDAGDYSQGTTNVSTTKGADAVAMMNAAGYDVVTIGNHEFDYGYEQLMDNMSKAEFKVVCADVFDKPSPVGEGGSRRLTDEVSITLISLFCQRTDLTHDALSRRRRSEVATPP